MKFLVKFLRSLISIEHLWWLLLIIGLREIMSKVPLVIVCIDETKLDESFPDFQFHMENYHDNYQFSPFRRYINSKRGGKLDFVKNSVIAKRVKDLETKVSGTVCIELTISNFKFQFQYPICL